MKKVKNLNPKTWATLALAVVLLGAVLLQGCKADPTERLAKMGIPFTTEGLMNAVNLGNLDAVDCFLQAGMDPNVPIDDATLLGLAAEKGYTQIARLLLDRGAQVDAPIAPKSAPLATALQAAAQAGHGDIVVLLLQHSANPNAKFSQGMTALHLAAMAGDSTGVDALIGAGADVNLESDDGWTPLHLAVEKGTAPVVQSLLSAGAKKDIRFYNTDTQVSMSALFRAVQLGKADTVITMLKNGFSPNERLNTWRGDTALMAACSNGDLVVARALVDGGADVNLNASGNGVGSPLTEAVWSGSVELVKFLIQEGSDLSATVSSEDGSATGVLGEAVYSGKLPMIQELLDAGLDINGTDEGDPDRYTPLMKAAEGGTRDVIIFLIGHGADPSIKSKSGLTAADVAEHWGWMEIVDLLR